MLQFYVERDMVFTNCAAKLERLPRCLMEEDQQRYQQSEQRKPRDAKITVFTNVGDRSLTSAHQEWAVIFVAHMTGSLLFM